LFVNGQSVGKKSMEPNGYLDWEVAYAPGTLSARGYRQGRMVAEDKVETTGAPAAIQLSPWRKSVKADREDIDLISVAVVDAQGRVVPTADNEINFEVNGAEIIGVGNGDPSSHEPDKASRRKVFNGWAQVIVQATGKPGTLTLTAASPGLKTAVAKVRLEHAEPRPAVQ